MINMDRDKVLKLDNQLCFIIYAASRALTNTCREFLADLGLTYPQYLVMLVLWEQNEITVKQLGERLYMDSGTLTPLLKRLETVRLVTRNRSREDERKVIISLTPEGEKLKEKAYGVPEQLLCRSGLSLEEFRQWRAQLLNVFQQLQKTAD